jgi:NRAMP (natural resistance-associated macrophage protein)-like metal ion transporter
MTESKAIRAERELRHSSRLGKLLVYVRALGPGLITGASDDDPSGIGTYAQTGAQFGYSQLWTSIVSFPLMTVVQEMCARVAMQTGTGLADVLRTYYPRALLYFCVALLFVANTINVGADLGAMAAAGRLLLPFPFLVWLLAVALIILGAVVFIQYRNYSRLLRFLTLSLFAYIAVVFVVHQDWQAAFRGSVLPSFHWNRDYLLNLVAILGTTISPYLFFWQANEEVEEEIEDGKKTLQEREGVSHIELKWMRTDVSAGMLLSNVVMWFIIVTAASTLFRAGITQVDSAPKAAEALKPIAGAYASLLFAAGIIGTGLLAVPILAGAAAYALAAAFRQPHGLGLQWYRAPFFYGVIVLSTLAGAALSLAGINPMRALYYTAVLNGLVAPPLLFMIMLISNNRRIMRDRVNGRVSNVLGWTVTALMTLAAAALLFTLLAGS